MKKLAFLACLLPLAVLLWRGWGLVRGTDPDALGADPIREAEIYTGLWTLRLLAVTLAVTPVRQLAHWNALAKLRRMLGLFTFSYACVHLSLWIVDYAFDGWGAMWGEMGGEIVKHRYILVGMATFLLMLPLAVTSTRGWVRRLSGGRWARLHRLVYLCAIGGTVHYLWAVKKDTVFPLVYLATFALLLGYRVWRAVERRRERRPQAPRIAA